VFTGGIGENSPEIRCRICEGLKWVGLEIDERRNARGDERISIQASRMAAYTIRTDEEKVIAREACRLLASDAALDCPPGAP
jgi:acetate kinase